MTHAQIPRKLKEPKPVRETGSETTLFLSSSHVTPFAGGWPRTRRELALLLQEAVRQDVTGRLQWLNIIPYTVQGSARPGAAVRSRTHENTAGFSESPVFSIGKWRWAMGVWLEGPCENLQPADVETSPYTRGGGAHSHPPLPQGGEVPACTLPPCTTEPTRLCSRKCCLMTCYSCRVMDKQFQGTTFRENKIAPAGDRPASQRPEAKLIN